MEMAAAVCYNSIETIIQIHTKGQGNDMETNTTSEAKNLTERTLAILEYLSAHPNSASILEISQALNIPTTSVHRALQTIKDAGYVRQLSNREYGMTYKLLELASNVTSRDPLINTMFPFMCYFAGRYNCQVGLSVFFGTDSIIHLTTVGSAARFNDRFSLPGMVLPAYCTAAGKVFLSQMSEDDLNRWLETNSLTPRTSATVINADDLKRQIAETRSRGYGIVQRELYEDICCVSVPIVGRDLTIVGTMNFSTAPEDFSRINRPGFAQEVRDTLAKIRI